MHLVLLGDKGESRKVIFHHEKTNFDKGKTDIFNFKAKDVGELKKIRIGHDNTGLGSSMISFRFNVPGWFLNEVRIKRGDQKWIFTCYRWFATDQDDGQIERELISLSQQGKTTGIFDLF